MKVFFIPLLFLYNNCFPQLKARFTTSDSITGGCSPLIVSFKNLTTGASSNAVYYWDLGNNSSSNLQNPAATYMDPKTYIVSLVVIDSFQISSDTMNITIYENPTVNFSVSQTKGCIPFRAKLTSLSTANAGYIRNYLILSTSSWKFLIC